MQQRRPGMGADYRSCHLPNPPAAGRSNRLAGPAGTSTREIADSVFSCWPPTGSAQSHRYGEAFQALADSEPGRPELIEGVFPAQVIGD
jgi:hypothetical protein